MSRHDLTARIAYTIFAERGYAHGRHVQDWFTAETIVSLCEAVLAQVPTVEGAPDPVTLLTQAVDQHGRKAVAGMLGYRSTSTVGKVLRQDREPSQDMVDRILHAFAGRRAA